MMLIKAFTAEYEVKAPANGGAHATFTGYASTFGNMDLVGDVIRPGAFRKSVRRSVPLLWQHRMDTPIGRIVKMREDDHGLLVEGRINVRTQVGSDAYELLRGGDVDSMSIGFIVPDGGAKAGRNGVREITEVELIEVSLVTWPANPKAVVEDVKEADIAAAAAFLAGIAGIPTQAAETMVKHALGSAIRASVGDDAAAAADAVKAADEPVAKALAAVMDDIKELRGAINVRASH